MDYSYLNHYPYPNPDPSFPGDQGLYNASGRPFTSRSMSITCLMFEMQTLKETFAAKLPEELRKVKTLRK